MKRLVVFCFDTIMISSSPNGLFVAPPIPIISESSSSSSSSSEDMNSKRVSFGGSLISQQPSKEYPSSSLKNRSRNNTLMMMKKNKVGMSTLTLYLTFVHESKEMIFHDHNHEVYAVIRIASAEVTNTTTTNHQARTSSIFATKKSQQPKPFTIYGTTPMYTGQQAESTGMPHDMLRMIRETKKYDEKDITNSREINAGQTKEQELVLYEWAVIEAKRTRASLLSPGKLRLCLELAAKTKEERKRFVAKEFSKNPEKKWLGTIQKNAREGQKLSTITLNHSERSSQIMVMMKKKGKKSSPTSSSSAAGIIDPKSCVSFLACTQEFIEFVCSS